MEGTARLSISDIYIYGLHLNYWQDQNIFIVSRLVSSIFWRAHYFLRQKSVTFMPLQTPFQGTSCPWVGSVLPWSWPTAPTHQGSLSRGRYRVSLTDVGMMMSLTGNGPMGSFFLAFSEDCNFLSVEQSRLTWVVFGLSDAKHCCSSFGGTGPSSSRSSYPGLSQGSLAG